ncbi:RraA family protein [Salinarimonas rosea]|uniref:RraA family protein n=1 Tax=Salinarimonas rosea TaxID=552063 RepID=UPI00048C2F1B|nr:RraA family protein [Salinarimonas rosea]
MTLGFRIVKDRPRPPKNIVAAFRDVPVANISDNMSRMFAGGPLLRPYHRRGRMSGVALTVRTRPGDNLMVHKALDMAEAGDVIVVDAGGDLTNAILGELMLAYARSRGAAGVVVDGAIRDVGSIATDDFPVYARGATHRGPYKDGPGEINVPVSVGGIVVAPGDIVVGDEDGVLAVPLAEAEETLVRARAQQEYEVSVMRSIVEGNWDRTWVDQSLAEKGCTN